MSEKVKRRNSSIKGEGDHPRYVWCADCRSTVPVPTEHPRAGAEVKCPKCGLAGAVVGCRFVDAMGQGFEYEVEWSDEGGDEA